MINTTEIINVLMERNSELEKEREELYEKRCTGCKTLRDQNKRLREEKKDLLVIASSKVEMSKYKVGSIVQKNKILQKSCYEKDKIISELRNEINYLRN